MNNFLFFNLNRDIDHICDIDFPENFNWYHLNIGNIPYYLNRHLYYFLNCKHIVLIELELYLKVFSLINLFFSLINFFINTVLGFNDLVNLHQKFMIWFAKSGYLHRFVKDFTLTLSSFEILKRNFQIVWIDILLS